MPTNADRDCVPVHTPWQDVVYVPKLSRLRVTDPAPVFVYRMHGQTRVSREPMLRVEFYWNEGRETGVARATDLIAAGVAKRARQDA